MVVVGASREHRRIVLARPLHQDVEHAPAVRLQLLALDALVQFEEAGLLEAYVLFARTDEGIARDYVEYRKANRDKLRRYLTEYVASGKY